MVEIILYILSFGAGIALFLYMLSLYHHLQKKTSQSAKKETNKAATVMPAKTVDKNFIPASMKERTCPVCGSKLSRYEALYASKIVKDSTKILIYGCRYCYKPDEDPDKIKKSDI